MITQSHWLRGAAVRVDSCSSAFPCCSAVMDKSCAAALHGVFSVFKPAGIRSFEVVKQVRRVLCAGGQPAKTRVGHGGTLDQAARGVIVIGIGRGCRQLESFLSGPKTYQATGKLGALTDTLDATGKLVKEMPFHAVRREHIESCIPSFVGDTLQIPPEFSALKIKGKRASDRARGGEQLKMHPRNVHVSSLELVNFDPPHFSVVVSCGSGFYVRSLVRDIGEKVGCCAHVVDIFRTAQGQFKNTKSLMSYDELDYERIQRDLIPAKEVVNKT